MRGVQLVFHQAAMASVPLSVEQPRRVLRSQRDRHAQRARGRRGGERPARDVRRQQQRVRRERDPAEDRDDARRTPLSPYAASKVAGEGLMRAWAQLLRRRHGVAALLQHLRPAPDRQQRLRRRHRRLRQGDARRASARRSSATASSRAISPTSTTPSTPTCSPPDAPRPISGDVINVACGKRVTLNQLAKTMADALERPDLTPIHKPPAPAT